MTKCVDDVDFISIVINQSTNQPINQSTNQPINQPVNRLTKL
ncbi:hypothetical protein [Providencia sp. PROV260]|nr:hypothetical protein [Providencia sp. PROV260]